MSEFEKTREWKSGDTPETGTEALGQYFNEEFDRVYAALNFLRTQGGVSNSRILQEDAVYESGSNYALIGPVDIPDDVTIEVEDDAQLVIID